MNGQTLFDPLLSGRLCLALLHSLWQVALLAIVVWLIDHLRRKQSAGRSYALHVAALALSLIALPITFTMIQMPASPLQRTATAAATAESPSKLFPLETPQRIPNTNKNQQPTQPRQNVTQSPPATTVDMPAQKNQDQWSTRWLSVAPWAIGMYAIGVLFMLTRLFVGIFQAERLGSLAKPITEGPLAETLRSLSQQWSLRVVPALARAEKIVVPKVVGLLRPTILLPAAALTGLSTSELEMILTHELAHVRRYDMWVNLLQRLAEVVLFFNPALWYLSRRISTLREYCCDEMTCQAMSGSSAEPKVRYATALLRVVELVKSEGAKSEGAQPKGAKHSAAKQSDLAALAASGRSPSELRRRVARLFGEPVREPVRISRTGMLTLAAVALLIACSPTIWPSKAQTAEGPNETSNATNRFSFGGKVEVLAIGTHGEKPQRW